MAQAIISPLLDRGVYQADQIFGVVGRHSTVISVLKQLPVGLQVVDANDLNAGKVWNTPLKLLSVKPQQLNQIKESFENQKKQPCSSKPLLISILAGVKLERLSDLFPCHTCVRAVPNTPSLIGKGLTGLSWGEDITDVEKQKAIEIFEPISEVFDLPEEQLDAFLALTSSGPAYVALIAEALADGAVAAGLPRSLAYSLSNRTLLGSAALLEEKGLYPGELKDMVASPAGTTIRALRHLEKAGVRSAFIEAVVLAAERSRQLA